MIIYKKGGFTLIELLIVIAVMAILTTVVFVALNPLARFQDARNNSRWTDVNAIVQAVKLDQVDNGGTYLASIAALTTDLYYQIGTGSSCADSSDCTGITLQTACVDLSGLVDEGYLPEIPIEPNNSNASATETRYYLSVTSLGTLTVGACNEEAGSGASTPVITVSR